MCWPSCGARTTTCLSPLVPFSICICVCMYRICTCTYHPYFFITYILPPPFLSFLVLVLLLRPPPLFFNKLNDGRVWLAGGQAIRNPQHHSSGGKHALQNQRRGQHAAAGQVRAVRLYQQSEGLQGMLTAGWPQPGPAQFGHWTQPPVGRSSFPYRGKAGPIRQWRFERGSMCGSECQFPCRHKEDPPRDGRSGV